MITFTAAVTPITATGNVLFLDGTTTIGTQTLNGSGIATFKISNLIEGTHSLSAVYSGDLNDTSASSSVLSQIVNKGATLSTLSSSLNPSIFGEPVLLTAYVSATSPSSGTPTGSVTFKNGLTTIGTSTLNGLGIASLSISNLSVGNNSLTVVYGGDSNFNTSTSTAINETINKSASITQVSSTPNPSNFGSSVTANVTVIPFNAGQGIPTGTVNAYYGSLLVGTGTLNGSGQAALTLTNLPAGTLGIIVDYLGDSNFLASSAQITQTVNSSIASITLTSSNNPSVIGQSIIFTGAVTSTLGTPTGTVVFLDGSTTLGTQTLNSNGVASLQLSTLSVGTHSITAIYSGDTNHLSATSTPVSQMVNQGTTTTTLSAVPLSATFGQTIALYAIVNEVSPASGIISGNVVFKDGTTILGTVAVDGSGHASLPVENLSIGTHSLTAVYNGDAHFTSSTSTAINETINKSTSVTQVSSTPNPSNFGSSVTANVTVVPFNAGQGTPTGTVNAYYGSLLVGTGTLNGSGQAALTLNNLPAGTLGIIVDYLGDTNFLASSTQLTQTVNNSSSSTLLTSSINPTNFEQATTLTATVTSTVGIPTGSVVFYDGTTTLATITLNGSGVASLSISNLSPGNHPIHAVYSGAANINPSTSSTVNQIVNPSFTSTALTTSPNPLIYGSTATFTAVVTSLAPGAGIPAGTITFQDGSTVLETVILDNTGQAVMTTNALNVGTHSITANYNGNTNFASSSSPLVNQVVNQAPTITTIVSSSPNPSIFGETIYFYAEVTAGTQNPPGTMTFFDGTTQLGTVNVYNGLAIYSTALSIGTHLITATYNGNENFAASTTVVPHAQVVNQINITVTTVTTLTSNLNPSNYGDSVTFNILVAPIAGVGTPTGLVTLYSGSEPLVTLTLTPATPPTIGSVATYTTSALPAGTLQIVALYSGDSNFSSSTVVLVQVVNPITTNTILTSSLNPSLFGDSITFNAHISTTTGPIPTGTVTFYDGSNILQTLSLDGSANASYTTNSLAAGSHTIEAIYNPDKNFITSNSTVNEIVHLGLTNTSILSSTPNPSALGQTVTFIAATTSLGTNPTGTVTFFDGALNLGTVPLVGNLAIFTDSNLTVGAHSIIAMYNGSDSYATSTSLSYTQVVEQPSLTTSTLISSSLNPSELGQNVTFNVQVASSMGIPTGSVTLYDGGSSFVTGILDINGFYSYSTSALSEGVHSITAIYDGDSNYSPSNSNSLNQIVNPSTIPNAPANFDGIQIVNHFLNRNELVNVLSWNAPSGGPNVLSYKIYRDAELTDLIGVVPVECQSFIDEKLKNRKSYTYYLVASNENGHSAAVSVTVYYFKACKNKCKGL